MGLPDLRKEGLWTNTESQHEEGETVMEWSTVGSQKQNRRNYEWREGGTDMKGRPGQFRLGEGREEIMNKPLVTRIKRFVYYRCGFRSTSRAFVFLALTSIAGLVCAS